MKNSGLQLLPLATDTHCCSKQSLLPFWTTDAALLDFSTNVFPKMTNNDSAAGQVSVGMRDRIRTRLSDEFWALGTDVVFRLLLLSLSGVTVSE